MFAQETSLTLSQNFVGGTQFLRPPKDEIHLWGAGHMSSVFIAAFDPIFFIFHKYASLKYKELNDTDSSYSNIDRLTAMWQMLNWDKWFDDKNSLPTRDSQLTPFHKTTTTFWKSDDVRDWKALGYEYEIPQGTKP